ncbi:zinc finger protein 692 isoform X2 [Neoarius graeffei]|uniref:zinc finger protein 692 isoform X2 n=1 Tax=Neoarius graeffei TaxID=443677 RepID=UPI00298C70AE|nr:zinc finger protein 692 isoform X2 [Neoarius graeffei]
MASNKEAQRRQRRRELDARRNKFRVRLGSWPESWSKLKEQLGFSLHSELAQFLLDSFNKVCSTCSGDGKEVISVSVASLDQLVLLVHSHGQQCPLTPSLHSDPHRQEVKEKRALEEDPETSLRSSEANEAEMCLKYVCEVGHMITWHPKHTEGDDNGEKSEEGSAAPSGQRKIRERRRKGVKREEVCRTRRRRGKSGCNGNIAGFGQSDETEQVAPSVSGENKEAEYVCHSDAVEHKQDAGLQEGSDAAFLTLPSEFSAETEPEECQNIRDEIQNLKRDGGWDAIPNSTTRERERREDAPPETGRTEEPRRRARRKTNRQPSENDEVLQISGKRKRKPTPKLILPCEFDGCWKIFSSRQHLNHHMKYQHFQPKTFACSDPSCGKSFNFKKHLKEHEKLHSDQRDYICEFCARGFRTSSNLSIHRRIHTGEKPLQCEVCGFTCRQKASLNWHMRKHDAERGYRFACEICGRRFEKRDNVTAHRSKSHPDHVTSDLSKEPTANDF